MGGLRRIPEFRRSGDLPSRVADHLLWLGRYMERAEGLIRLLRSVYRRLAGEASLNEIPELAFLLNLLRSNKTIPDAPGTGSGIPKYRKLYRQLNDALYGMDRPGSVMAVLDRVRDSARSVRDRLSPDSWRVINRLEGLPDNRANDTLDILDDTLFILSAFSGLAMESMTRSLGWRFLDMGRRLERAANQTHLLRKGLPEVCEEPGGALEALLEVSDSIMTYRARYRTAVQLAPALDLLIADESNPKSLGFQCNRLAAHVAHLPRQGDRRFATPEERIVLKMLTSVRLVALNDIDCSGNEAVVSDLYRLLEDLEGMLGDFARQITAHYLSRVPVMPHFSIIPGTSAS
jgi:uncharacterized alpha-E superfamily protein